MARKKVREYFDFYIDVNHVDFYAMAEVLTEYMVLEEDLFDIYSHNKKAIIPFNIISKLSKDEIEILKISYVVEKRDKESVFYINNINISTPKMNDFLKLGYFNYFTQENNVDLKKKLNMIKTQDGQIIHLDVLMDNQDMQYKKFNHEIYLIYMKNLESRKRIQYYLVQYMKFKYLQHKRDCYKKYIHQKKVNENFEKNKEKSLVEKIICFFKKRKIQSTTQPVHMTLKPKVSIKTKNQDETQIGE